MISIREKLIKLRDNHGLIGVKGGTEVEAMNFEEINFLKQVSNNIVPLTVKIGGPEARNDIDYMLSIGTEYILAPMVESPYGLKNFVTTMQIIDTKKEAGLSLNIETITAYKNLEDIFRSEYFEKISSVTVGRSDLSGSIGMSVDDDFVMQITKKIIRLAKYFNKKTSIGGQVDSGNAKYIRDTIHSDSINTRHMIVSCSTPDITESIIAVLEWESELYETLSEFFPLRRSFYKQRIDSINSRKSKAEMSQIPVLTNEDAKCTCI